MIQGLANKITQYLFAMKVCKEEFEVHRYGIEVIISTIIDFIFIMVIGFVMGHLEDAIIYYFAFWIIRKFSGGYHCQTYFHCISLHVMLFIIYILTSKYYLNYQVWVYLFSIIVFLVWSPIKNRELDNNEYRKYKIISLNVLMVVIVLSYITHYTNILTYVILIVSLLILACIKNYED